MDKNIFSPADILLYNRKEKTQFSVVACDQYTSEPEYWDNLKNYVGDNPSALNMIFPEIYLKNADFDKTIENINSTMDTYLKENLFDEEKDCFIFVKRKLRNGKTRYGIVGKIDLNEYNYEKGSTSAIRATEGTVLERIPPRVKIRKDASLELPHVMLLIDDEKKTVIEPLINKVDSSQVAYDFDLNMDSGRLTGYMLNEKQNKKVLKAISSLSNVKKYEKKYGVSASEDNILLFAVGDGNHSLATAKKCFLELKEQIGEEAALNSPARYALVELVNLYDESLEFEAIHRIINQVDVEKLISELNRTYKLSSERIGQNAQPIDIVINGEKERKYILNPAHTLAVGSIQIFLDEFSKENSCEIDYIHGEDVILDLTKKDKNSIGFLLPCMDKTDLFKAVILEGALPRKTFSMGEACDKRFYYEARKIK